MLARSRIQVPVTLLRDPVLSAAAKVVWGLLRCAEDKEAARVTRLERRAGLSRKTVLGCMAALRESGWLAGGSGGRGRGGRAAAAGGDSVPIPGDLLADRRVGVRGRILYGYLQLLPAFRYPSGEFRYGNLIDMTGDNRKTVRRAVADLAGAGWLDVAQEHRRAPVRFSLRDPFYERALAEVERVGRRLERAPFLGEAIMREYLSLLVAADDFQDDAAPGFLVNPLTGERMQLDRFYPPGVAFEFNGPQHYGATERFTDDEALRQRARDLMKLGLCAGRGIRMVVVHPGDLTLHSMRRKIAPLLPLRDLGGRQHLVAFLESVSRRYRLAAKRKDFATG